MSFLYCVVLLLCVNEAHLANEGAIEWRKPAVGFQCVAVLYFRTPKHFGTSIVHWGLLKGDVPAVVFSSSFHCFCHDAEIQAFILQSSWNQVY